MDVTRNTRVVLGIPACRAEGPRSAAGPWAGEHGRGKGEGTGLGRSPRLPREAVTRLLVVGAEVVVLQADRLAGGLPERLVRDLLVGPRGRVDGGPRIPGRLHPDATVPGHAGA